MVSSPDRPDERPVPAPNAVTSPDQVTIRRAPRFSVFILGGAVLGFLVTVVVVLFTMGLDRGDQQETTGFTGLVGYFSLYGVSIGMLVGALVAVVLDRTSTRRAARLTAERVTVDPGPGESERAPASSDAEPASSVGGPESSDRAARSSDDEAETIDREADGPDEQPGR